MAYKTNINKNNALGTLDLEVGVSKDTILERSEELRAQYETSVKPQDHAKLADIYEATKTLLEDNGRPLYPREIRKRRRKIGVLISLIVMLVLIIIVISSTTISRRNTYSDLQTMMKDVSIVNYESMGETINALPDGYKNMRTIKEEYTSIKNNIEVIEDNNVFEENQIMREAYYELVSIDEETDHWDLSYYLGRVDNRVLLLDIRWENTEYFFILYTTPKYDFFAALDSSLPSAMEDGKSYTYFTRQNKTVYGLVNIPNRFETFRAFEILSIEEDEIRIYAFKNDEIYILYPVNS